MNKDSWSNVKVKMKHAGSERRYRQHENTEALSKYEIWLGRPPEVTFLMVVKDNKKDFCTYLNGKEKDVENVGPLLNGAEGL